MTKSYLLPYNCTRCGALRRMYYEVVDSRDKTVINTYYESKNAMITLNDVFRLMGIGEEYIQLLCRKCRKHQDLMDHA